VYMNVGVETVCLVRVQLCVSECEKPVLNDNQKLGKVSLLVN
jgi:hypothetical protein